MSLAWQTYAANEPRFVEADRALLFEPGGTNLVTNPRGEGAVVGTPGTLPTGWSGPGGSITAVVGTGLTNGVPWVELEVTASSSGSWPVQFAAPTLVNAAVYTGQVWAAFAGAPPAEVTGTNLRMTSVVTSTVAVTLPTDGTPTRHSGSFTANAAAASVFQLEVTTSGACVVRVRLGWPDLKQDPRLTTPILPPVGTPGTSTRGADAMLRTLASLGISPAGASTWIMDVTPLSNVVGFGEEWLTLDDNFSVQSRFALAKSIGGELFLRRDFGGTNQVAVIFSPTVGVRLGMAMTVRGDGSARLKVHGQNAVEVTGGPTTGLLSVRFSGRAGGANPAHTRRRRCAYLPYAVSNAMLDTLAAQAAAWS